jgi:hypothetical protein
MTVRTTAASRNMAIPDAAAADDERQSHPPHRQVLPSADKACAKIGVDRLPLQVAVKRLSAERNAEAVPIEPLRKLCVGPCALRQIGRHLKNYTPAAIDSVENFLHGLS